MAIFRCEMRSAILNQTTRFNFILPDKCAEDVPVIWLLHGLSGNEDDWIRYTSIERYANDRGLAIVMPYGGKSFFCDMRYGGKYYTYLADELPMYIRRVFPVSSKREKNFVAGLSMGGYGALKLALDRSESYAACAAFSGAVDIYQRFALGDRHELGIQIWGENYLNVIKGSVDDTYALAQKLEAAGKPKPWIFQACGTEDKRYHENQSFRSFIQDRGYVYEYQERPGGHTWDLWDYWIVPALDFFLRCMNENGAQDIE